MQAFLSDVDAAALDGELGAYLLEEGHLTLMVSVVPQNHEWMLARFL